MCETLLSSKLVNYNKNGQTADENVYSFAVLLTVMTILLKFIAIN